MRNKYLIALFVVGLLFCGQNLFAEGFNDTTIADLTNLVAKINTKLVAGKTSEADFADNIKEFDTLLARHKNAKPEDLEQIFVAELQLYLEVFNDPESALKLLKHIKQDYPAVQINGNTDQVITNVEPLVAQREKWRALAVGTQFHDFNTKDTAGKPLSLDDYNGKVVLIDFWATWCPPCQAELPNLLKTYSKYHSQGFDIIGVSLDDSLQKLLAFTKMMNMPWPQSCDGQGWRGKLVAQYGVYQLPGTVLLNGEGTIIGKDLRGDELEQAVAKALSKK
ncbi:MAG TPA: TlpA disulfide reductase family protein [Candidatus Saccharimonadales bacterium]|nr:TlpA disulfide reductase family protein [Candidatus Saccharimonadales bacterium]